MDLGDVAVATITLVRHPAEEPLLRRALTTLAALGAPVYVSDGGSAGRFIEFLHELPNVRTVVPRDRGLVGQVQASVTAAAASGRAAVLYTESDKVTFFAEDITALVSAAARGEVLIAARTAAARATFPSIQQFTESTINTLTGDAIGVPGDYSYGPFVLGRDVAAYVSRTGPALGWGWRHYMFAVAHRLGRGVRHHERHYACPPDQRVEDAAERIHRMRQLSQNVAGLVAGLTTDL